MSKKLVRGTLDFSDLVGKTLLEVKLLPQGQTDIKSWYGGYISNEALLFTCKEGEYLMFHEQDCCESVSLIDGFEDLQGIVGSEVLGADEETSQEPQGVENVSEADSYTWTFYKIHTEKGFATLRWYGTSNGYYSESVNFYKVESIEGE